MSATVIRHISIPALGVRLGVLQEYNPNQRRVAAGQGRESGRWISSTGTTTTSGGHFAGGGVTDRHVRDLPADDISPHISSNSILNTGGRNVNVVHALEYTDASGKSHKAIFKPTNGEHPQVHPAYLGRQAINEVCASIIDREMRLDMIGQSRMAAVAGSKGSLTEWINDTAIPACNDKKVHQEEQHITHRKRPDVNGLSDMLYLDALIGNTDRHLGNWLVKDGNAKLIDHGMSFPTNQELIADDGDKLRLRDLEHLPVTARQSPMSAKFKKGLDRLHRRRKGVDALLKASGLEDERRDSFWKRVDYLRKTHQIGFSELTLRDLAKLAEGKNLFEGKSEA